MAVVFIIMTALTVIVIGILVLRYRRGNYSIGTKQKYSDFRVIACVCTSSDLEYYAMANRVYSEVNALISSET